MTSITIATVVFNRRATIADAIRSVLSQDLGQFEYLIIDGMSTDGTEEVVRKFDDPRIKFVQESDDGIYDALNKAIRLASNDVIGFLHADDLLHSETVLSTVKRSFEAQPLDAVYGDLLYVDAADVQKTSRYWQSGEYTPWKFRCGWMPPHPTFYVRKTVYEEFGDYRLDLGSAADYECMLRLIHKHQIRTGYIPEVLVRMRNGGVSNASLRHRLDANSNDRAAWILNGIHPAIGFRFLKPMRKLLQYTKTYKQSRPASPNGIDAGRNR